MADDNAHVASTIELDADWDILPIDKPRRLVIAAVVGESPAVVTETLWALFNQRPSDDPERIVIFTTTAGRKQIRGKYDDESIVRHDRRKRPLSALSPARLPWEQDDMILALCRLCREWQRRVPVIEIHVPRGEGNREIDDIRTEADDRSFGNAVFREIRRLTDRDKPAVHASIAGGRKTMGTRLASVLSMFGRPQDELSHVLVTNPDYEGVGYWCPSKLPGVVSVRTHDRLPKKVQVADQSVVQLVRQRFWPLRNLIDEEVLRGEDDVDIDDLALAVEAMLKPPPIIFKDNDCVVYVGDDASAFALEVELEPKEYALYRTLAETRLESSSYADSRDFEAVAYVSKGEAAATSDSFNRAGKRFLDLLEPRSPRHTEVKNALYVRKAPGGINDYFTHDIDHINDKLMGIELRRRAGKGPFRLKNFKIMRFHHLATFYTIKRQSKYGDYWRVGIDMDPSGIRLPSPERADEAP